MTILICFPSPEAPEPPEDKACLVLGDFVSSVLICKQFLKIFGAFWRSPHFNCQFEAKEVHMEAELQQNQSACLWQKSV